MDKITSKRIKNEDMNIEKYLINEENLKKNKINKRRIFNDLENEIIKKKLKNTNEYLNEKTFDNSNLLNKNTKHDLKRKKTLHNTILKETSKDSKNVCMDNRRITRNMSNNMSKNTIDKYLIKYGLENQNKNNYEQNINNTNKYANDDLLYKNYNVLNNTKNKESYKILENNNIMHNKNILNNEKESSLNVNLFYINEKNKDSRNYNMDLEKNKENINIDKNIDLLKYKNNEDKMFMEIKNKETGLLNDKENYINNNNNNNNTNINNFHMNNEYLNINENNMDIKNPFIKYQNYEIPTNEEMYNSQIYDSNKKNINFPINNENFYDQRINEFNYTNYKSNKNKKLYDHLNESYLNFNDENMKNDLSMKNLFFFNSMLSEKFLKKMYGYNYVKKSDDIKEMMIHMRSFMNFTNAKLISLDDIDNKKKNNIKNNENNNENKINKKNNKNNKNNMNKDNIKDNMNENIDDYEINIFNNEYNEFNEFNNLTNNSINDDDIYLKHKDLLINKTKKLKLNEIKKKKKINNNSLWDLNKKHYEKYKKSSLNLTKEEIEKLKEIFNFDDDISYTIYDLFNYNEKKENKKYNILSKKHITDNKLKTFHLELMSGFLYDKQCIYEKEILNNKKIFNNVKDIYNDTNMNVVKVLNLFPRDFIKKYKITKKLGQGVYGKVFNVVSLNDCSLNFAIKCLRYYWPNFKFKFGLEEFACNELNIMRHILHPNVVCLIDHFRAKTYRENKNNNNKRERYNDLNDKKKSEEYDFSIQRNEFVENACYSPSEETKRKNKYYNFFLNRNKITVEEMEAALVLKNINIEKCLLEKKKKKKNENIENRYSSILRNRNKEKNEFDINETDINKENTDEEDENEDIEIDKLHYRKYSKNYKKIENKDDNFIENWNLFLVMEKCDSSLSDILEKVRYNYSEFINSIKYSVSQLLEMKTEVCYEHLQNYVKYVFLPQKKKEQNFVYPDLPALSEIQTKVIIYQMLQGINQIHKEFVIHRDIKPANTLIKNIHYLSNSLNDSREWIVKIGDFGLSVHDNFFQSEKKDTNIITLQYRPPEIMCNNDIYNYSVDIWSVGITMCECLLGYVPVASKFDSSVLFKILVFRGIPNQYFKDLLENQFIGELPNFQTDRLKMLNLIFTDIYGRKLLSDDGIDILDKFLSYDYKKRITANKALRHKWFKDVDLYLNEELLNYYKENGTYYF